MTKNIIRSDKEFPIDFEEILSSDRELLAGILLV